jgi:hypothetical protein
MSLTGWRPTSITGRSGLAQLCLLLKTLRSDAAGTEDSFTVCRALWPPPIGPPDPHLAQGHGSYKSRMST